jgi:hypothetical protein
MGTSNFYRKNARSIYAVLMDYEDDVFDDEGKLTGEKEMRQCESWDVDNLKEYVIELAIAKATELNYNEGIYTEKLPDDRNYEGVIITSLRCSKELAGVDIDLEIQMLYRIGYYEGACLDWHTIVNIGNNKYIDDEAEDVVDDRCYWGSWSGLNDGMLAIQAKNIQKFINQKREEMINAVEEIFTKASMPLEVVERFSNGETIYRKIEQ